MTELGDFGAEADVVVGPLRVSLAPLQQALLEKIWYPLSMVGAGVRTPGWPTWDYVSRSLYQEHPDLADATTLLASLPTVPPKVAIPNRRPYGFVWHSGHAAMNPGPEDRVGLTIAGLSRIATPGDTIAVIADELAGLIRWLADLEARLPLDPDSAAKGDVQLADSIARLATETRREPIRLTEPVIAAMLQREYAPLQVYPASEADSTYQVRLGYMSLREFRSVASAEEYLDLIGRDVGAREPHQQWRSPLTLVQTLDYLGYVLHADPLWTEEQRLTQAPDLQSAAALTAVVTTKPEYDSALSGLWNIIDQLHVPPVPATIATARFGGKQPRSIARLDIWLDQRLQDDPAGRDRAGKALGILRAVGRIRSEPQHNSAEARADATKARVRLGLPEAVYDFGNAWDVIRDRLSGALDVILQTVKATPPPADAAPPPQPPSPV